MVKIILNDKCTLNVLVWWSTQNASFFQWFYISIYAKTIKINEQQQRKNATCKMIAHNYYYYRQN